MEAPGSDKEQSLPIATGTLSALSFGVAILSFIRYAIFFFKYLNTTYAGGCRLFNSFKTPNY